VRIHAKRVRYAIETGRPVIGAPAAHHAAQLAPLQEVLGDLHDSTVAVRWLRKAAHDEPAAALVAGQFIAAEHAEQARVRQLIAAWQAADAKQLRHWL
jgi:CHAD domain-containing protein